MRVGDYNPTVRPLGRLTYSKSFSQRRHVEKETKTGVTKQSPAHPVLAAILDEWIARGWARLMGRAPDPSDLMFPRGPLPTEKLGIYRDHTMEGDWRERHCTTLGLRTRRLHDARRSFISLSQDDGADPSVIRRITHPGEGDVFSSYTTYSWARMCAEVAKLNIRAPAASLKLPEGPRAPLALPAPEASQEVLSEDRQPAKGASLTMLRGGLGRSSRREEGSLVQVLVQAFRRSPKALRVS
jgi:hypothetical protein